MRSGLCLSAVGETSVGRPAAFAVIGDLGFAHYVGTRSLNDSSRMKDRVSHTREWCGVVEDDAFLTVTNSELAPESGQVDLDWGRTPRFIEVFEHRRPSSLIRNSEYPVNRPFVFDRTVGMDNSGKSVLKPEDVLCLLTDSDVGNQAEERATPLGAPPCMRIVEALIEAPGLPMRHPV